MTTKGGSTFSWSSQTLKEIPFEDTVEFLIPWLQALLKEVTVNVLMYPPDRTQIQTASHRNKAAEENREANYWSISRGKTSFEEYEGAQWSFQHSTCTKALGQSTITKFTLCSPCRTYIPISAQALWSGLQNCILKGRQCTLFSSGNNACHVES